ncbi:MAG: aldo/keto reductase, partial [Cyanobacteria bacterium NC_groundwater_1444_Ag_S-0.65um_54_12]|nr:aldo/keto reductase [Cyanobacteria bacterium NC_groundwater_1444_Ag_S-0.65um_54_12]
LLRSAWELGISWWDTSNDYGTHQHVRFGLQGIDRWQLQISTKSHAESCHAARRDLELALAELGVEFIDLYFLHEVDSPRELKNRLSAYRALKLAQAQGLVRAVGLSTHNIDTLEACLNWEEFDVIMTNFNRHEDHMDAGLQHYTAALSAHHAAGRGVTVMKAVGEGRLAAMATESIAWNLGCSFVDAVLVGMDKLAEVRQNAALAALA